MTTIAGEIVSYEGEALWDEPIYVMKVTTPYTKMRNAKGNRGWAEMPVIGVESSQVGIEVHGAN
jgi:hypothetical protein